MIAFFLVEDSVSICLYNQGILLDEHLESLYGRYVMESQRASHQTSLNRDTAAAPAPAASRIELF